MDNFYTQIQKEIHENAIAKGWHETERSYLEYAALFNCEIAEASEEFRSHKPAIYYVVDKHGHSKPEGWAIEWADLVIRILDYFGVVGFEDVSNSIKDKRDILVKSKHKDYLVNETNEITFNQLLHNNITYFVEHEEKSDPVSAMMLVMAILMIELKYPEIREAIKIKMEYNKTRPYRHGNKKY